MAVGDRCFVLGNKEFWRELGEKGFGPIPTKGFRADNAEKKAFTQIAADKDAD
jgi:hypothetical protein